MKTLVSSIAAMRFGLASCPTAPCAASCTVFARGERRTNSQRCRQIAVRAPCVIVLLLIAAQFVNDPASAREPPQVHAPTDDGFSVVMSNETVESPGQPEGTGGTTVSLSGFSRHEALIAGLTIFVLAVFVGFEVITKVSPTLHTPLMSGSNAISGITVVGALLAAGERMSVASLLGTLALVLATINVVGGFLVTGRMLAMFQKKK